MDVEVIENLVKVLSSSAQLTELEVRQGDVTLRLRRPAPAPRSPKKATPAPVTAPSVTRETGQSPPMSPSGVIVMSELVGIFRARRPEAMDIGHIVKAKHVMGQIEAMRLMNDIAAPQGGRVQAVLVQDGQPVQYGQPLFEIVPEEAA